jgi:hypothetical protein
MLIEVGWIGENDRLLACEWYSGTGEAGIFRGAILTVWMGVVLCEICETI